MYVCARVRVCTCACMGVCMCGHTHIRMLVFMNACMCVVAGKLVVYNRI